MTVTPERQMDRSAHSGPYYIGIDIGGTNMKIGIVSKDGESLSLTSIPTEAKRGPKDSLNRLFTSVERSLESSGLTLDNIKAIGLATPGTMDIPAGMLLNPPNLTGWINVPIRQIVEDHFGKPTILQNDASAAAYGEYWMGAARKANSLVFWTLGTGIGCGIIVNDMIIQGAHSHGSECGHIIVQMDGGRQLKGTGQFGTLEAYTGAKSLVRRCQEELATGRPSILNQWMEEGETLTTVLMAKAAESSDALCEELIMDAARCMGIGTVTLMHTIDPDMVLFGGAMTFGRHNSALGRRFIQRIKDEVNRRAFPVPAQNTHIDYATLGGSAGYIGSAGCAKQAFENKE